MRATYHNYESRESNESKIVKELDRFDIMVQAFQYERQEFKKTGRVIRFDEFFRIVDENCFHPLLVNIKDRMFQQRDKFYEEIIKPSQKQKLTNGNGTVVNPQ